MNLIDQVLVLVNLGIKHRQGGVGVESIGARVCILDEEIMKVGFNVRRPQV